MGVWEKKAPHTPILPHAHTLARPAYLFVVYCKTYLKRYFNPSVEFAARPRQAKLG